MPSWDPTLYLKFADERTRPSLDLVSGIVLAEPERVIDLGCGPGNSTAVLQQKWPEAEIYGLDSSAEMITQARAADDSIHWILSDIKDWNPDQPFDLIFSNAALQWVPDHETIFPQLIAHLKPAGGLAVQLPYHYESPLHRIIQEVSHQSKWSHLMEGPRTALIQHDTSFYYELLSPLCRKVKLWETRYYHLMADAEAILNWISGTGLRPYLEALESDDARAEFKQFVLDGYRQAYPKQTDGKVIFPFCRQFMQAYK